MTKIHLQNKWAETNNSVCALLRQAHDVLALTSLPMQQVRKPLTDEEIRWLVGGDDEAQEWNRKVVKAVELAHGIGVEDEPDSSVT